MGGNIPPPYPITSSESLKKDTHRCFPTALVLNSNTESFPPSTCFSLLALWQEQSLSLVIQITPKRDTRWSPKQMVIYTGHRKHSRIWLLHGSRLGPCQAPSTSTVG